MSAIGLTSGAFYSHSPSKKQALCEELIREEVENSSQLLAGDQRPPPHVAQRLRGYLSSFHATNPESGCAARMCCVMGAAPIAMHRRLHGSDARDHLHVLQSLPPQAEHIELRARLSASGAVGHARPHEAALVQANHAVRRTE